MFCCLMCGKTAERKSSKQKYCGSPKLKDSCSYKGRILYYRSDGRKQKVKNHPHRHQPKSIYYRYKYGAKDRNIDFDLLYESFLEYWGKPCFYCNSEIKTIGLDRVNNNEGYKNDNIVSCCKRCNLMKGTLDFEEFVQQCLLVSEKLNGRL